MKPLLAVLCVLLVSFMSGCQTAAPAQVKEPNVANQANEALELFEQYWNNGEDAEAGAAFMRRFKENPAAVLEALALASNHREQMLILIGSTIAEARRNDPESYGEYTDALASASKLDLSEESRRMLGFVHANIEYWYSH